MDLKLARNLINDKPKNISLSKIESAVEKEGRKLFYFDEENSHKQLIVLVEYFEKKGLNVYHRIIHYGPGEQDYMYKVHALWTLRNYLSRLWVVR